MTLDETLAQILKAQQYRTKALAFLEHFLKDLQDICLQLEGVTYPIPCDWHPLSFELHAVKELDSLIKKIKRKSGQYEVTDSLRFTLLIDKINNWQTVIDTLKEKGYLLYTKTVFGKLTEDIDNLFETRTTGYRHVAVKLIHPLAEGLVIELQFLQPSMFETKNGLDGHSKYKQLQGIEAEIKANLLSLMDGLAPIQAITISGTALLISPTDKNQVRKFKQLVEDTNRQISDKFRLEQEMNNSYSKAFSLDNP